MQRMENPMRISFEEPTQPCGQPRRHELAILTFVGLLESRNAYLGDGVQRALGRDPADFSDFAKRVATRGVWDAQAKGRVA